MARKGKSPVGARNPHQLCPFMPFKLWKGCSHVFETGVAYKHEKGRSVKVKNVKVLGIFDCNLKTSFVSVRYHSERELRPTSSGDCGGSASVKGKRNG